MSGQSAHEKILNVINHQRNASETTVESQVPPYGLTAHGNPIYSSRPSPPLYSNITKPLVS